MYPYRTDNKNSMIAPLVLLAAIASIVHAAADDAAGDARKIANLRVGDEICAEGFVLDTFCIERNTLLDNPSVFSLEQPEMHSLHCLVDVASCFTSPFEMLAKEPGSETFSRGWRFDDAGREAMVALGRKVGSLDLGCKKCVPDYGTIDGTNYDGVAATRQERGFRAVVRARVAHLRLEDDLMVPELALLADPIHTNTTIATINIFANTSESDHPCRRFFGMPNILDVLTEEEQSILFTKETRPSFRNLRLIHGSCMITGWGLLLPNGMLVARYFKLHPKSGAAWFKFHRICQPLGLVISTIGWIVALASFDVFQDRDTRFVHGLVGSLVMALGWLQPLNAYFRPHVPSSPDVPKTTKRVVWEHYHRGAGWFCFFMALFTVFLGTTMIPLPGDRMGFQVFFAVCICIMLGNLFYMKSDSKQNFKVFCCTRKLVKPTKEKDTSSADDDV